MLAELLEEGSNRERPWHGDTHPHVTVGLLVCLQNVPALLLYSLGWLCEDCCVLSLRRPQSFFSVAWASWARPIFCASTGVEALDQVTGN